MNKKVGPYIYKELIGRGSSSRVYLGVNSRNKELVAIKEIDMSKLTDQMKQRIDYEIMYIKKFSHVNIVKLYSVIDDRQLKYKYLIFEYCPHGNFETVISQRLSEQQVKIYFQQIYDALYYLRQNKISHRDLKPENILLKGDIVKIADFGYARELHDQNMAETLCGTPLYMAPEILQQENYTTKADLWSLGLILYESVYHEHPFSHIKNIVALLETIKDPDFTFTFDQYTTTGQPVSGICIDLLQGLLRKDSTLRYTWEEFFAHPWFNRSSILSKSLEQMYYTAAMKPQTNSRTTFVNIKVPLTESIIDNYQEHSPSDPIQIEVAGKHGGVSLGQSFVQYINTSVDLLTDSFKTFNSL